MGRTPLSLNKVEPCSIGLLHLSNGGLHDRAVSQFLISGEVVGTVVHGTVVHDLSASALTNSPVFGRGNGCCNLLHAVLLCDCVFFFNANQLIETHKVHQVLVGA